MRLTVYLFLMVSIYAKAQVNFCDPATMKALTDSYDKQLMALPDFELPIINIKKTKTMEVVKSIKVPEFILGAGVQENRYAMGYSEKNLYKIDIQTEEITSFPHSKKGNLSAEYNNAAFEWKSLFSQDGNMYLYKVSKAVKIPLVIYKADFVQEKVVPYFETTFKIDESYKVTKSYSSNHLFIANVEGDAYVLDFYAKKTLMNFQFDLPQSFSAVENRRKGVEFQNSFRGSPVSKCYRVNYKITNHEDNNFFLGQYDVKQNKLIVSKVLEGFPTEVISTDKSYWAVSDFDAGTVVIYNDEQLTSKRFEFSGVKKGQGFKPIHKQSGMWPLEAIEVYYTSGKIETYDWATKKLIKTEESKPEISDF